MVFQGKSSRNHRKGAETAEAARRRLDFFGRLGTATELRPGLFDIEDECGGAESPLIVIGCEGDLVRAERRRRCYIELHPYLWVSCVDRSGRPQLDADRRSIGRRYGNAAGEAAFAIYQDPDRGCGSACSVYDGLVKSEGEVLDQITGDSKDVGCRSSDAGEDDLAVRLEGYGSCRVTGAKEVGEHLSFPAESRVEHPGLFVAGNGEV